LRKISEHITWGQAIDSNTAETKNIFNYFTPEQLVRLTALANNIYEPLCKQFGITIPINSFFRNKKVNLLVGGSPTSQHCANDGAAIDLDADKTGIITNKQLFDYIKDNMEFDQLIMENGWVHVSYRENNNRKQIIYK
jgi:zinc D-Ala-D-Ala carboxypeptidase